MLIRTTIKSPIVKSNTARADIKRRFLFILLTASILATSAVAATDRVRHAVEPVQGQYLVALKGVPVSRVANFAEELARLHQGHVRAVFTHASLGFAVYLPAAQAEQLTAHPNVDFVEEVAVVHQSASPQSNAPWQLDRIDQTSGLDGMYTYSDSGAGSIVYIIGNGVYRDHSEFALPDGESRVYRGTSFASDSSIRPGDPVDYGYWPCGSPGTPTNLTSYHDTAVASFAIGTTQGVAKDADVVPIRIISCSGQGDSVGLNYAIDWIMNPNANPYYYSRPAVVNMSNFIYVCDGFNTDAASYLENEINKLVGHPYVSGSGCTLPGPGDFSGIPVVVSANNLNTDAVVTSPARMAFTNTSLATCGHVISVGATDVFDRRWTCAQQQPYGESCYSLNNFCHDTSAVGSDYGPSVDIYAPGAGVMGAVNTGPNDYNSNTFTMSGTSWAAPIVAGVLARIMQSQGSMSCDTAWWYLNASGNHVIAWDQVGGQNKALVYRP